MVLRIDEQGSKGRRGASDGGLHEVEFGLNVSDSPKLHVENSLLLLDLLHLAVNEL